MEQYRPESFLKTAGLLDDVFLDVNPLSSIPVSSSDEMYQIGHGYDERPDLLAHALYKSSRLWWVFAMRNPDILKDPIRDFTAGTVIMLPSAETITIYVKNRKN